MNRTPVQSSNVVSIGPSWVTMEVEFKGGIYRYAGVSPEHYAAVMAAESKGKAINELLKPNYPYVKVN